MGGNNKRVDCAFQFLSVLISVSDMGSREGKGGRYWNKWMFTMLFLLEANPGLWQSVTTAEDCDIQLIYSKVILFAECDLQQNPITYSKVLT